MTSQLIFHSRTRAEADWDCQRKRYYAYDFEGGIVKDNLTLELFIGTCLHDATAGVAAQHLAGHVDIDQIAGDTSKLVFETLQEYATNKQQGSAEILQAQEQSTLVNSAVRGFYKQGWPSLIAQYPEIVGIERECLFPHDHTGKLNIAGPYVAMFKPDLILRGPDGLVYVEYKSTSTKKIEWIESWPYAIQVHATAAAIALTLGEEVIGTIVQGFYKGYSNYGKFSSDLVYGYKNKPNPPFTKNLTSYSYKQGYVRTPVWELEGGSAKWIAGMPQETLSEQLPQTPMIYPNEEMSTDFFRQRAIREDLVGIAADWPEKPSQYELDRFFPQSFSKCKPAWGHPCSYLNICHGAAKNDPLTHGFIQKSKDHEVPYHELAEELKIGKQDA